MEMKFKTILTFHRYSLSLSYQALFLFLPSFPIKLKPLFIDPLKD